MILRVLAPGDTILDVGANIGVFSVLASLSVGPSGRIVAFEPDPRNLGLNGLSAPRVLPDPRLAARDRAFGPAIRQARAEGGRRRNDATA